MSQFGQPFNIFNQFFVNDRWMRTARSCIKKKLKIKHETNILKFFTSEGRQVFLLTISNKVFKLLDHFGKLWSFSDQFEWTQQTSCHSNHSVKTYSVFLNTNKIERKSHNKEKHYTGVIDFGAWNSSVRNGVLLHCDWKILGSKSTPE